MQTFVAMFSMHPPMIMASAELMACMLTHRRLSAVLSELQLSIRVVPSSADSVCCERNDDSMTDNIGTDGTIE